MNHSPLNKTAFLPPSPSFFRAPGLASLFSKLLSNIHVSLSRDSKQIICLFCGDGNGCRSDCQKRGFRCNKEEY